LKKSTSNTYFWSGNEACAEAAITAGCRFFAGYPITPSSEIAEHLAKRLPQIGGIAIQMEDELASIGAIVGASWAGVKAFTATSGPGFSLMQEGIGYAFMTETPIVIVDAQRAGPSTGQATKCGQGDVMQARWGTHGDYSAIALSPNSVQEMFTLTIKAFNLAEKYRTPVVLLADEIVAHMREQVRVPLPESIEIIDRRKPEAGDKAFFGLEEVPPMPAVGEGCNIVVTGSTHDEYGIRVTADPVPHRRLVERLNSKIQNHADELADSETYGIDECEVGIVSYGCTSRSIYEAVEKAEKKGIKTGFARLRTLWPFPDKIIRKLAETAKVIIVPEMNLKQIFYEVERAACGDSRIVPLNKIGGGEMITPEELFSKIMETSRK
jgi:2-oxoglutarate ferredoxin oxidoreductase subunit alpha